MTQGWLDSVMGIANRITQWGANVGAASVDEMNEAVAKLKNLAREFTAVYNTLFSARDKLEPADRERVDALLRRGSIVKKTVDGVAASIDGVARLLPVKTLQRYDGLGIAPLVPIAAIMAAIAAITAWLADAYVEVKRLNLAEKVQSEGGDVSGVFGGGSLPPWAVWAAAGVGVILLVGVISGKR